MIAIHHLAVLVRDLERAEAFYGGFLGLPVVRRWQDEQGRPRSVWLGLDHGMVLAVERAAPEMIGRTRDDAAPGFHCLSLRITRTDRDAMRARLLAGGHRIERESPFTLYTRDPDGNLVAFSHYPDAVTPET